jgi:hypothetical protein
LLQLRLFELLALVLLLHAKLGAGHAGLVGCGQFRSTSCNTNVVLLRMKLTLEITNAEKVLVLEGWGV